MVLFFTRGSSRAAKRVFISLFEKHDIISFLFSRYKRCHYSSPKSLSVFSKELHQSHIW